MTTTDQNSDVCMSVLTTKRLPHEVQDSLTPRGVKLAKIHNDTMLRSVRGHVYLAVNSAFLSGLVFIGTQVLLNATSLIALALAMLTSPLYLSVVYAAYRLTARKAISDSSEQTGKNITRTFVSAAVVASIASFSVIPYSLLVNVVVTAAPASAKYYFYAIIFSVVVFLTTTLHFWGREFPQLVGPESTKMMYNLQLEFARTILWALAFMLLGTAYAQVLTGAVISMGEMVMVFYTVVGVVGLIFVPIVRMLLMTLDRMNNLERDNGKHSQLG